MDPGMDCTLGVRPLSPVSPPPSPHVLSMFMFRHNVALDTSVPCQTAIKESQQCVRLPPSQSVVHSPPPPRHRQCQSRPTNRRNSQSARATNSPPHPFRSPRFSLLDVHTQCPSGRLLFFCGLWATETNSSL